MSPCSLYFAGNKIFIAGAFIAERLPAIFMSRTKSSAPPQYVMDPARAMPHPQQLYYENIPGRARPGIIIYSCQIKVNAAEKMFCRSGAQEAYPDRTFSQKRAENADRVAFADAVAVFGQKRVRLPAAALPAVLAEYNVKL